MFAVLFDVLGFFLFPLAGFWAIVIHPTRVSAVVVYDELLG